MEESAVSQISVNPRPRLVPVALLLTTAMLFAALAGSAAAAPVGADGKIYACYKVKGKPKGALRILPKAKARCKRGERKVAWIAISPSGQAGAGGQEGTTSQGSAGSQGTAGSAGTDGSPGSTVEAKVSSLSLKVDGLEDVLDGVESGDLTATIDKLSDIDEDDLTGVLDKLEGITEGELNEALDASELVDELCEQTSALTSQANALEGVIDGLGLNNALDLLGGLIEIPELPGALDPFACSTP